MMSKQSYGRPQPGNGTYECRLDYGTFEIDAPRIGHFTNAPCPALVTHARKYTQDRVSVVQGKWAFKAGRTTGPTIGRQHGLGVCVRMWEKDRVQTETTEFPILSSDGTSGPLGHFSRPGDSGSLIYDQEGRPLGWDFSGAAWTSVISQATQMVGVSSCRTVRKALISMVCAFIHQSAQLSTASCPI
ncbi:hypothetical protein BKA67DRAFT_578710 [Truncatella angustata]|uniref:Uncharacterized protein n=1 Tax=Truncatella angustata TaxID=152316 RepID=A0A9P8UD81_9PEZI|nr:uncharacterized protein BKA67DRAFT_578710 [Truncatella angustata]KAH6647828.1 hypothetical protein BKA67DRAFT_578710 [Truncatella angustata]